MTLLSDNATPAGIAGRIPVVPPLPAEVEFILSALEADGISVAAVTVSRPSLDDVYLHYTGRDFRAEDEAGSSEQ